MDEVIVERVAFGHWQVTGRNHATGKIRVSLFASWEKEIAERFAARCEKENAQ
jgi:hypothetical protein